jgi:hypothetical protein
MKMTSIEKSPSTADMFGNGIGASVPPTITTLANRFVTGLPVCKFWTVNLSTDGVPIVGCSGVVLNRIFILFSLSNQVLVPFVLTCAYAGNTQSEIVINNDKIVSINMTIK